MQLPPTPNPKTSCDIAYIMTHPFAVVPVATASMTHPMNITTASCIALVFSDNYVPKDQKVPAYRVATCAVNGRQRVKAHTSVTD